MTTTTTTTTITTTTLVQLVKKFSILEQAQCRSRVLYSSCCRQCMHENWCSVGTVSSLEEFSGFNDCFTFDSPSLVLFVYC